MTQVTTETGWTAGRLWPLAILALGFVVGLAVFWDNLTFEALRDNRQALLAFRDSHYVAMVAAYMALYVLIVAFSLPGATIATLTGGFLFGLFPGVIFVLISATMGAR